jgi:hypothetical protein
LLITSSRGISFRISFSNSDLLTSSVILLVFY